MIRLEVRMSNALLILTQNNAQISKGKQVSQLASSFFFFNAGTKNIVQFRTCFRLSFSPLLFPFTDANNDNNFDINQ